MSQFADKTQEQFAEIQESHVRMGKLTASMDKIVKTLEEGHAQLSKASEETKKRLNQALEEQNHCTRDRNCLNIKPDFLLDNKPRSPSHYQDGDNMTYSEKEALKQLPEASRWPNLSGVGEYDHVEFTDYIDVPGIPD
ncbi:hypothetical protein O181_025431 [Austropuccinia psidii MF-1]|uniref:Uncharacterized protein n=1 Tax=Austropuccinia psidii MF-1 TaxID=1389203 RepID=A0A9Q3CII4_9BASI|nr:hypothetical protein [Austropuccinia psidii MF-1]